MTPWIVTGGIAAVLALLLFCPAYAYVYYDGAFRLSLRVLGIKFSPSLNRKKKKPAEKKNKKSAAPAKTKTEGKRFLRQLEELKQKVIAVKRDLLPCFSFRHFDVFVTVGTDDPCTTALLFGSISAACNLLAALVHSFVRIDRRRLFVTADYENETTEVFFDIALRTFLGKLLVGLIKFAIHDTLKSKE